MPKRKQQQPLDKSDLNYTEEFVIKKALFSTCKNIEIFNKIQKDVEEMSALFVETSRYIHYTLINRWIRGDFAEIKFADYYYHLMQKKKTKYVLDENYSELRPQNLPLYDGSYRSNLFIDSANQYETIFHNNIWMHAYSRLRRFLNKFSQDQKKIYYTLYYLFYEKNEVAPEKQPDLGLLNHMTEELQWDGKKLINLKHKKLYWTNSIKLFFNLQRFNERNNYRNFSLIPIFKHGAHHIRYDSFAFYTLLCSLKLFKGQWKDFNREENWQKYFKLPCCGSSSSGRKKFDFSLQTDGVAVSFLMQRTATTRTATVKKKKKTTEKEIEYQAANLEKIRSTHYVNKIGLDPGLRLLYGGVRNGEPIKLKNSTYQHMSGFHSRKIKLQKYTRSCPAESQYSPNSIVDFENYTRYQLQILAEKQRIFSNRKVTRLKLQKFICVEKTCHQVVKTLIQDEKQPTLVCIGSTQIAANSPMRGYLRTPNRKFVQVLRERKNVDVMLINEFRTTKLCANCFSFENQTSRSPHRYQFCPNCHTCWNRDVNAGVNILYLGECLIYDIPKHENFCKKKK